MSKIKDICSYIPVFSLKNKHFLDKELKYMKLSINELNELLYVKDNFKSCWMVSYRMISNFNFKTDFSSDDIKKSNEVEIKDLIKWRGFGVGRWITRFTVYKYLLYGYDIYSTDDFNSPIKFILKRTYDGI